jgi:hypothetical protein
MRNGHQARRHPFVFGVLVLVLSPYLLAFILLYGVAYLAATGLDMLAGRKLP